MKIAEKQLQLNLPILLAFLLSFLSEAVVNKPGQFSSKH